MVDTFLTTQKTAFVVCVDFCDILKHTLPTSIIYYSRFVVITSSADAETIEYIQSLYETYPQLSLVVTDLFYADGATFNKFRSLEYAIDRFGRSEIGWTNFLDADILFPSPEKFRDFNIVAGNLYSPLRHIYSTPVEPFSTDPTDWKKHPVKQEQEFAGYFQLFHSADSVLPVDKPWHDIRWRHAGGGDSFFQMLWSGDKKIRPIQQVLHLGDDGRNWCGRVEQRIDGNLIDDTTISDRLQQVRSYRDSRKQAYSYDIRYAAELLPIDPNDT